MMHTVILEYIDIRNIPSLILPSSLFTYLFIVTQNKKNFSMLRLLFELIQVILFYPFEQALRPSLRHILDKLTKGTFHSISYGPQKIQILCRAFGNFSERTGMALPCQSIPQKVIVGMEKLFLFWVDMNILLETVYFLC